MEVKYTYLWTLLEATSVQNIYHSAFVVTAKAGGMTGRLWEWHTDIVHIIFWTCKIKSCRKLKTNFTNEMFFRFSNANNIKSYS